MEFEVKNCSNCPFLSDTFFCCRLKAKNENRSMNDSDTIDWDHFKGNSVPEWCPLRKEDVVIKISK